MKKLPKIVVVVCFVAVAVYLWSLDWHYSHIVSVDCGHHRTIHIYEDSFCDFARTPVYEVEIEGQIVSRKFNTRLWLDCGRDFDPKSFRLVMDDSKMLVAVVIGEDDRVVAIYDFDTRLGLPRPEYDPEEIPIDLLNRLGLATDMAQADRDDTE